MPSFTAALSLQHFFLKIITMIIFTSRSILMRKVRAWRLDNLELSGADCFVLDMLADNLPHTVMDQVCSSFIFSFCLTFTFSAAWRDLKEDLPKA